MMVYNTTQSIKVKQAIDKHNDIVKFTALIINAHKKHLNRTFLKQHVAKLHRDLDAMYDSMTIDELYEMDEYHSLVWESK